MDSKVLSIGWFLQRAYDTHALVYWPSTAGASTQAASGTTYEYGVVFVPGTGAGVGPAYRHRPASNKYPGPIDTETFRPDHEVSFENYHNTPCAVDCQPVGHLHTSKGFAV